MKTVYKIKSGHDAAIHGFRTGDFSGADAIHEHNENILRDVFRRIMYGLTDYAYVSTGDSSGGNIYIISRDTVYSSTYFGAVRVTCINRYGSGASVRLVPCSHRTFTRVCDFLRDSGIPSGRLVVVGGWYDNLKRGCA